MPPSSLRGPDVERCKLGVIISMMVMCNDIVIIIEYNRRRSGLPSAPLDMEYDNNSVE